MNAWNNNSMITHKGITERQQQHGNQQQHQPTRASKTQDINPQDQHPDWDLQPTSRATTYNKTDKVRHQVSLPIEGAS
jgi:hypothetical protein